ncbi:MAG: hypothetical protein GKR93_17025 [Gammaproteobacteria bacterium]|nr:hypothetical protein [Gammaproteobacteria bacterium]
MMVSPAKYFSAIFFLLVSICCQAQTIPPECETVDEINEISEVDAVYKKGLLWKISSKDVEPSYLFGTIHVSDEAITSLPEIVENALDKADTFVMELVPNQADAMTVSSQMYFSDGQKLNELVSAELFEEIVRLLVPYHLPREAIKVIKPWGAFLTMSYPPDFGTVLDLQLMERAKRMNANIQGLESLHEQIDIFNSMSTDKQLRLLRDTACNHESLEMDFEKMKALYLARDLQGLISYGSRHSASEDLLYNELLQKLLIDRNYTMTERMQSVLQKGRAFIAIGAMHLAGDEGVLSLLEKNHYKISLEY